MEPFEYRAAAAVSNRSALHTASPSGERSVGSTLLETYTASHTPTDWPVCEHVCVGMTWSSMVLITQPMKCACLFLAYRIGAGVPTVGLQKRRGLASPVF